MKFLEGNYRKNNSGGMRFNRNDMGQQRSNGMQGGAGMKRRWDSAGGMGDQGQNKRPYQQPSSHFSGSSIGGPASGSSYQQKQFRPNSYDHNKSAMPPMSNATSYQQPTYPKFPAYAPMQMPPSLAQYPGIASAVANYTFPPPSSVMPPLPK